MCVHDGEENVFGCGSCMLLLGQGASGQPGSDLIGDRPCMNPGAYIGGRSSARISALAADI